MLIGIDASRANRERKTGVEWYAYRLIRELAKLDDKNQYILYSEGPLKDGLVDLCSENPAHQVAVCNRWGRQQLNSPFGNFRGQVLSWPWRWFWTQGRMSLSMLLNSPDVLFVPSHTLPIIHPRKSLVTIHDVGFKNNLELYADQNEGPRSRIIRALVKLVTLGRFEAGQNDYLDWSTKFALDNATKITTNSDFSKKEILKYYQANEDKITVIKHGYNKANFYPRAETEIKKVLLKHGLKAPYIVCVGRVEKKKNTARLIEAFALVKAEHSHLEHKLVLIGPTEHGYDEVRQIISQYELESSVILSGWVPDEDLPAIYSGAAMFVFPSKHEGFGIPLLEAMACGTPIAASRAGAIPEVVGDAAVMFNPNDASDIADKIIDLILSQSLRDTLIAKGLERVKLFGWDKTAKMTLEVLNSLKRR